MMALSQSLEKSYNHVIIKEEVMISDIKEEPCDFVTSEASSTISDNYLEADYNNTIFTKKAIERQEHIPRKTTRIRNKKFETTPDTDASAAQKIDIAEALNTLSKVYCSKCIKKTKVVPRKARCEKCKTPLIYHCESCSITYKTYTDLCYHLKWKHVLSSAKVNCHECGKTFADLKGLKAHLRVVHGIFDSKKQQKSLTCNKCGKSFAFSTYSLIHKRDCGKGLIYKCDDCPFNTNYKSHLITHMKEKHLNFEVKCKNCKKVFTNKKSMKRHWKIYCGKRKLLICFHCDRKLYRKDELVAHIRSKHPRVYGKPMSLREKRLQP